jgi:AcrR family transcriptional regulator
MDKKQIFDKMIAETKGTREKLFLSALNLFSVKGYENVGIRELCGSLGIKESSFYNHYKSKDSLLKEIWKRYREIGKNIVITDEEIDTIASTGDVDLCLGWIFEKFNPETTNPLFYTMFQVVRLESFTNPEAAEIAQVNIYHVRCEHTEKLLGKLRDKGFIRDCNIDQVTSELYYGILGFSEEFLLQEIWGKNTEVILQKIVKHVSFIADYLKIK